MAPKKAMKKSNDCSSSDELEQPKAKKATKSKKSSKTNSSNSDNETNNWYITGEALLKKYPNTEFYKIIHHYEESNKYKYKENDINIESKFDASDCLNGLHFTTYIGVPDWINYYGNCSTKIAKVTILPDGRYIDSNIGDNKFKGDKIHLGKFESLEMFVKNNNLDIDKLDNSSWLIDFPIDDFNNLMDYDEKCEQTYVFARQNNEKMFKMNYNECESSLDKSRLINIILKFQNFNLLQYFKIQTLTQYMNKFINYSHHPIINDLIKNMVTQSSLVKGKDKKHKKHDNDNYDDDDDDNYDDNDDDNDDDDDDDDDDNDDHDDDDIKKGKNNATISIKNITLDFIKHRIRCRLSIDFSLIKISYNKWYDLILHALNFNNTKILHENIPYLKHHLTFKNAYIMYHLMRIKDYETLGYLFENVVKFDDIKHHSNIFNIIHADSDLTMFLLSNKYVHISYCNLGKINMSIEFLNVLFTDDSEKETFIRNNMINLINNAIIYGNVSVLKYCVDNYQLDMTDDIKKHFELACDNKKYDIVEYLFAIKHNIANNYNDI